MASRPTREKPGVLSAYGFSAKKDLLAQLLELNLAVAQRLEQSEPVTPPGIPAEFPKPEALISGDCIRLSALAQADHSKPLGATAHYANPFLAVFGGVKQAKAPSGAPCL